MPKNRLLAALAAALPSAPQVASLSKPRVIFMKARQSMRLSLKFHCTPSVKMVAGANWKIAHFITALSFALNFDNVGMGVAIMFDFYLVQIKPENVANHATASGKPKRGVASLVFLDCRENGKPQREYYDLRGGVATHRQFQNWAKREFGYLRYEAEFG